MKTVLAARTMSCFVTFLVLLSLLIVASGPLLRFERRARHRRRAYQQLARRFHGRHQRGSLFRSPMVALRHGRSRAVLREANARGPYIGRCMQVQLEWSDKRLTFEIFPRAHSGQMRETRRFRAMTSGDPSFDESMVVRGRNERDVRQLLSDGVRWQINRLHCLDENRQLYLLISHGQLLVQIPVLLRRFEELESLVAVSLDFYDQLMLTQAEGIEFVDQQNVTALDEIVCQICGEAVLAELVYCRRCKTPHHQDCWEYTGACSVFGCFETRYLRPQSGATPAEPQQPPK